jgi:hypothetical protein
MAQEQELPSKEAAYDYAEKETFARYPGRRIKIDPDELFTGAQSAFAVRDMDIAPEKPESGLGGFEIVRKANGKWIRRWFPPAS